MTDRSGDFVCSRLFLCLVSFVVLAYKRWEGNGLLFPHSSLPFLHHYYPTQVAMSSPAYTSVPFSYQEDACAQDVVESMEQVGDLASSCLIWAYEIFLGS